VTPQGVILYALAGTLQTKAFGLCLSNLTCNVLGGTAKLCLTVLAWGHAEAPEDTVKLRLAVPPGWIESPR